MGWMKMPKDNKEITVPNLRELSDIFLETLREISKSGTKLSTETFAKFLARKPLVKEVLKLAKKGLKEKGAPRIPVDMEFLQSELDAAEGYKKAILQDLFDLETRLDREKDFTKRMSLVMYNLSRVSENEPFFDILDEFKQLIVDDELLENREKNLQKLKNLLLREDVSKPYKGDESAPELPRSSVIRRFLGDSTVINLKSLKKAGMKGLDELDDVLGEEYRESLDRIKNKIEKSDTVDYLLSQRAQVIGVIHDYIRNVMQDRKNITVFIREVSNRLIDMERTILTVFTDTNRTLNDDYSFHENLKKNIENVRLSVEKSTDYDNLKALIISELSTISSTLDEKHREYIRRMEKADQEKENLQKNFETMISNIVVQNKSLIEKSQRDPLTGIFNRATFDEFFLLELERFKRYMVPFSMILFDIDYFKSVNDTYGHEAGDRVLKGIASHIRHILRKTDVLARYGGEEFVVLMPDTGVEQGRGVAEKLRELVQNAEFIYEGQKVPVTISLGITQVVPIDHTVDEIYKRVDRLMYTAKERGRNMVVSDADDE